MIQVDYLIIGAGIYGLYAAKVLANKYPTKKIIILECDKEAFLRASYVNQARVHNGYHYPRSLSTAKKSAIYYDRFNKDFSFAINKKFKKVYAVSKNHSYTSSENFVKFCKNADILCNEVNPKKYFLNSNISSCFIAEEFAFDAQKIKDYFLTKLSDYKNVEILFNSFINTYEKNNDSYIIKTNTNKTYKTSFILNATYASINQLLSLFNFETFEIKYELAEICLCTVGKNIKDKGITIMDGPFFSIMPFGLTCYHSLSTVHYTPHISSYETLPKFPCQKNNRNCTSQYLENCSFCPEKPFTYWNEMKQLAKKYFEEDIGINYIKSLFAIKPILKTSELDDSRPTIIKEFSKNPRFISVLSGKINTIYDLDEVLLC